MKGLAFLAAFAGTVVVAGCTGTPPAPPSFPGSVALDAARASAASGAFDKAADSLAEAQIAIEEKGPLRIKNLTLVDKNVEGFGLYTPIKDATLKPGDPILLYFEPSGFVHEPKDGRFHTNMTADFALLSSGGAVLVDQPEFLKSEMTSLRRNREIQFEMRFLPSNMPKDANIKLGARVTLHDKAGNKTATETIPISVRP